MHSSWCTSIGSNYLRASSLDFSHLPAGPRRIVIDDVSFYEGPNALLFLLHHTRNLQSLSIGKTRYPSSYGLPDGASRFEICLMNAYPFFPCCASTLFFILGSLNTIARPLLPTKQKQNCHLPHGLRELSINVGDAAIPIYTWLSKEKDALSSISSLRITSPCLDDSSLAKDVSLNHLTQLLSPQITELTLLRYCSLRNYLPLFDLSTYLRLHTLAFQIPLRISRSSAECDEIGGWVRDTLKTVQSPHLRTVRLTIDLHGKNIFERLFVTRSSSAMAELDTSLASNPMLEEVEVRVGVIHGKYNKCEIERKVAASFPRCRAREVLIVKAKEASCWLPDKLSALIESTW